MSVLEGDSVYYLGRLIHNQVTIQSDSVRVYPTVITNRGKKDCVVKILGEEAQISSVMPLPISWFDLNLPEHGPVAI